MVSQFLEFSVIFYIFLKLGRKRKRKIWNSIGLNFDFSGLGPGENVRAPTPTGQVCAEVLGVFTNCERVPSLLLRVTDALRKSPPVSVPLLHEIHDDGSAEDELR